MAVGLACAVRYELDKIQSRPALEREALTVTRHGDALPAAASPCLLNAPLPDGSHRTFVIGVRR
jgi:hypothetical protein